MEWVVGPRPVIPNGLVKLLDEHRAGRDLLSAPRLCTVFDGPKVKRDPLAFRGEVKGAGVSNLLCRTVPLNLTDSRRATRCDGVLQVRR